MLQQRRGLHDLDVGSATESPHGEALDEHGALAGTQRQACRTVRVGGCGEVVDGGADPGVDLPVGQARRDPVEQGEAGAVEPAWRVVHLLLLHLLLLEGRCPHRRP